MPKTPAIYCAGKHIYYIRLLLYTAAKVVLRIAVELNNVLLNITPHK